MSRPDLLQAGPLMLYLVEELARRLTLWPLHEQAARDELALVMALTEGRRGGAGLDVYQDEPNVPEPLLGPNQVMLQPHQGSATRETRRAMADLVIGNLDRFFAGESLLTPLPSSPSLRSVSA